MTNTSGEAQEASEEKSPGVGEQAGALLKQVRSRRRRFSRVKNLLAKIDGKEPSVSNFDTWLKVRDGLDGYDVGIDEIDEQRRALVDRLESVAERLSVKARMKFMTKFNTLVKSRELEYEKVSENPLVLYVDPLTFEVDFNTGAVQMLYGHESIEQLPIDAGEVLDACEKTARRLKKRAIPAGEFFDLLRKAYRTILVADGAEPGDRVDLVDVLVPLSMLVADRDKLRKKGPEALEEFPRYRFAHQLAMLRREGLLEKDGVRLDLGAATGGSTRDKDDVLYIPIGATGGQYYGALRFEQ